MMMRIFNQKIMRIMMTMMMMLSGDTDWFELEDEDLEYPLLPCCDRFGLQNKLMLDNTNSRWYT